MATVAATTDPYAPGDLRVRSAEGEAFLEANGWITISADLHLVNGRNLGESASIPPGAPLYQKILNCLGGLKPGERKPIPADHFGVPMIVDENNSLAIP